MIWLAFAPGPGSRPRAPTRRASPTTARSTQAEAQAALGWQVDLALAQTAIPAARARGSMLADRHGNLLEDARRSRAAFVRPTHEGHDLDRRRSAPLRRRATRAEVALPLAGQWELHLTIAASAASVWREHPRGCYLRP